MRPTDNDKHEIITIFRAEAYGESRTFDNREDADKWLAEKAAEQEID